MVNRKKRRRSKAFVKISEGNKKDGYPTHKILTENLNFYINELINTFEERKLVRFYIDGRLSIWKDRDNAIESAINHWRDSFFYRVWVNPKQAKREFSKLLFLVAQIIVQQTDSKIKEEATELTEQLIKSVNETLGWNLQKNHQNRFGVYLEKCSTALYGIESPKKTEHYAEEVQQEGEVLPTLTISWKVVAAIILMMLLAVLIIALRNLKS